MERKKAKIDSREGSQSLNVQGCSTPEDSAVMPAADKGKMDERMEGVEDIKAVEGEVDINVDMEEK